MDERSACELLKQRFEAAGFLIAENVAFEEDGIRFEIDGFDAERRVGYEYLTEEAGDSWDVGEDVIAALAEQRAAGTLFVLVVGEHEAPDAATLAARADAFLASLPRAVAHDARPARRPADEPAADRKAPDRKATDRSKKPASDKPAAGKPDKPAAGKPAAGKPAAGKPAAGKPADKPAAGKSAPTGKPAAKKAGKPAAARSKRA